MSTKEILKKEIDNLSEEQAEKLLALIKKELDKAHKKKINAFIKATDQDPIKTDKINIPKREDRNAR
jgi:hypothetical protein